MSTLVISKNYKRMYELQKEHKWGKPNQDFPDLDDWVGKRVGIAGYGSIGRQGEW
jgi:phosphoglycerate dehydrogenase-like enzyme